MAAFEPGWPNALRRRIRCKTNSSRHAAHLTQGHALALAIT